MDRNCFASSASCLGSSGMLKSISSMIWPVMYSDNPSMEQLTGTPSIICPFMSRSVTATPWILKMVSTLEDSCLIRIPACCSVAITMMVLAYLIFRNFRRR